MDVNMMIQAGESTPDIAPLFGYRIVWFSMEGSGRSKCCLTFRHRASCILGQAFRYSPENAFYIFNQQIYFII